MLSVRRQTGLHHRNVRHRTPRARVRRHSKAWPRRKQNRRPSADPAPYSRGRCLPKIHWARSDASFELTEETKGHIAAVERARKVAVSETAAYAELAGEVALGGLGMMNEGADWILTINESKEGNYSAAIAFLPLISAAAAMRTGGRLIAKYGDEVVDFSRMAGRNEDEIRAALKSLDKASDLRKMPGTASGVGKVVKGKWLRGTNKNAGIFPKRIAIWPRITNRTSCS